MKRQIALLVLILALVAVGLFASKATGGGGGCYERVRSLEGTRVDIGRLCSEKKLHAPTGGDPARRFQPDGGEWFYVFLLVLGASLMLGLIVLGLARKKS